MTTAIYAITNQLTGDKYVGSAVNHEARWAVHLSLLRKGAHHSRRLQRAWVKYGADAFAFSILEEVGEPQTLIAREQDWIGRLGSFGRAGYNMTPAAGTSLGIKRSPETIERLRIARTGVSLGPHSPETRAKISAAQKGIKRGPMSDAHKAAIADANRGRKMSEAARAKLSKSRMGVKRGPMKLENRLAIAKSLKGRIHSPEAIRKSAEGRRGQKRTEGTRAKMRAAWARRRARQQSRQASLSL